MEDIIILIVLITVGYFVGSYVERKHYVSIQAREKELLHIPAVTLRNYEPQQSSIKDIRLVSGNAVISIDYFKRLLYGLRGLIGGRITAYESLVDRARREAVLRMKESVRDADIILNLRVETSSISKGAQKAVGTIEALAYGTALIFDPDKPVKYSGSTGQKSGLTGEAFQKEMPPLEESNYYLLFKGEVLHGKEISIVRDNIVKLFNLSDKVANEVFSGKSIIIKKNIDIQRAKAFKEYFEKTGAICYLKQSQ